MIQTVHWQPKVHASRSRAICAAAPAASGDFYYSGEYAYFGAYFFVSSHAERRVVT
jgi:hypothetical protein